MDNKYDNTKITLAHIEEGLINAKKRIRHIENILFCASEALREINIEIYKMEMAAAAETNGSTK